MGAPNKTTNKTLNTFGDNFLPREGFTIQDYWQLWQDKSKVPFVVRGDSVIEFIQDNITIPDSNTITATLTIDYSTDVLLNAVWYAGNLSGRVSTETNAVTHNVPRLWHFSRIDAYGNNLDLPNSTTSLFDYLVDATDGTTALMKVYNREDESQYVFLYTEEPIIKANPTILGTTYYDLEVNATVLTHNNVIDNTIQNPSVHFIIGRSKDVVRNNTDTYTSYEKIKNAVTLSHAEYGAITTPDANTLFVTPCDGNAAVVKQETIDAAIETLLNNVRLADVTSTHATGVSVASISISGLVTDIPSGYSVSVYSIQEDSVQSFVTSSVTLSGATTISVIAQNAEFDIASGNYVILSNTDIIRNIAV